MASLMAAAGRPRSTTPAFLRAAALRTSSRASPTTTRSAATMSAEAWGGRHDGSGGRGGGGGWSRAGGGVAEGGQRGWAMAAAAGLALAVGAGGAGSPREGAKNCGIVGVVSSADKGGDGGVVEFLYEVRRAGDGAGGAGVARHGMRSLRALNMFVFTSLTVLYM